MIGPCSNQWVVGYYLFNQDSENYVSLLFYWLSNISFGCITAALNKASVDQFKQIMSWDKDLQTVEM